jgi:aquaporin Z
MIVTKEQTDENDYESPTLNEQNSRAPGRFPWRLIVFEAIGTALLVLIGLSLVTVMFGMGSPMLRLLPDEGLRRLITGFLFGTTGAAIAVSAVGRVSGAHINPAVTLGFWLMRKIDPGIATAYVLAQLVGGSLGALPLLAWGSMGRSVAFGATLPGEGYAVHTVLLGEVITTFIMVSLLTVFLAVRRLRPYTPAIFPFLYAVMVFVEAPISGTSTNPARSLGPAIVSGEWQGWWIYWAGPVIGAFTATLACSFLAKRIEIAKLYHFDNDHDGLFRRMSQANTRI